MESVLKNTLIGATLIALSACGSDGTSSDGGGNSGEDVSFCVTRTLRTVYTNDCEFDVNVIVFEIGAQPFKINANRPVTRSASGNSFGACRVPSVPMLNASASGFTCS